MPEAFTSVKEAIENGRGSCQRPLRVASFTLVKASGKSPYHEKRPPDPNVGERKGHLTQ